MVKCTVSVGVALGAFFERVDCGPKLRVLSVEQCACAGLYWQQIVPEKEREREREREKHGAGVECSTEFVWQIVCLECDYRAAFHGKLSLKNSK